MRIKLSDVVYPMLSVAILLTVWQGAISVLGVPTYLLPPPAAVFEAIWTGYSQGHFWPHLFTTLTEVVVGYAIGCTFALLLGAAVAEWRPLERIVMPYVVALQSMPKVALAPLLIVWFGFGISSKIALVVLICFFPVFVNSIAGFRSAHPHPSARRPDV